MSDYSAYPLCWPLGQPRTPHFSRERGTFKGSPAMVREEMIAEIDRLLGVARGYTSRASIIISSNLPLRNDGMPRAGSAEPTDPGIAVYFDRKGKQVCFACDKYDRTWKNMRAITKTIEAMRGIERWGSKEMMDRAFTGFEALPAPGEGSGANAWKVLGIEPGSGTTAIEAAFRALAKKCHPDTGGSAESWHRLQDARRDAIAQSQP